MLARTVLQSSQRSAVTTAASLTHHAPTSVTMRFAFVRFASSSSAPTTSVSSSISCKPINLLKRQFHSSAAHRLPSSSSPRSSQLFVEPGTAIIPPRVMGHSLLMPFATSMRVGGGSATPPSAAFAASPASSAFTASSDTPASLSSALNRLDAVHEYDIRHTQYLLTHPPAVNRNALQRLWHDYGWVGVGTYLSIYVGTLGMLFVAIRSGLLGADTVLRTVHALGLENHFEDLDPKKGDFLMAWVATKLTEPVRAAITAIVTPKIARAVGMAPPKTSKEENVKKAEEKGEFKKDAKH